MPVNYMMGPINNAMLCFSIMVSFMGGTKGLMPASFKRAIAANKMKMEYYLIEDSEVDPNRHCDWIFVTNNTVIDKEGKWCMRCDNGHNKSHNTISRLHGNDTTQIIYNSEPPPNKRYNHEQHSEQFCMPVCCGISSKSCPVGGATGTGEKSSIHEGKTIYDHHGREHI